MTRFFKYWLPVVIWAGVIFWFSSQTTPQASNVYWQEFAIKKFAHIVIFGILAGFIYRALRSHKITAKNSALLAIVIASVYGLSDEFHQSFTPGREPTLRDVFFDTIGATLVSFYLWKLLPKAPKKLRSWARKLDLL